MPPEEPTEARLPTQAMPFFRARFELHPRLGLDSQAPAILARIRDGALARTRGDFGPLDWLFRGGQQVAPDGSLELRTRAETGDGVLPRRWALRLDWKDPQHGRLWTEDVGMERRDGGVLAFSVADSWDPVLHGDSPDLLPVYDRAPELVQDLIRTADWRPRAGSFDLSLGPRRLGPRDVPEFLAQLRDPARRCPVVVLSRSRTHPRHALPPDSLAQALAGAAVVVAPDSAEAEEALRSALSADRLFENLAVRVVPPAGADPESSSPNFLSPARLAELGEEKSFQFVAAMAMSCLLPEAPGGVYRLEDLSASP